MPSGFPSEEERSRRPVVYPVARRLRIPFFIMRKFLLSAASFCSPRMDAEGPPSARYAMANSSPTGQ